MSRLQIKVEHDFAIHQNLWTWNGFYLGLKIQQGVAIGYTISVLLSNIWTYMRGNQISYRFACAPAMPEEFLQFILVDSDINGEDETSTNAADDEEGSEENELADDDE